MLATSTTVEFSTNPILATKAATNRRKHQSKVTAASAFTAWSTWAKLVRSRTEDEKRDQGPLLESLLKER